METVPNDIGASARLAPRFDPAQLLADISELAAGGFEDITAVVSDEPLDGGIGAASPRRSMDRGTLPTTTQKGLKPLHAMPNAGIPLRYKGPRKTLHKAATGKF